MIDCVEVREAILDHGHAEDAYESQVRETEETVLELIRLKSQGGVGPITKEYAQVELMSLEAALEKMFHTGKRLVATIRKQYGLREECYSGN